MSITLEQLSARMRQGEQVPLRHTAQVALTLSIPSILQQIVVTAMEYIDAAMVGHIGAEATSCSRMEGMLSASAMRAVSDSGMSSPCRIRAESCSKESVMSSPVFCVDKLSYYYRHGEENCQTGRLIFWLWRDTLSE